MRLIKSQLKYDDLNEQHYYEDNTGNWWWIFDDNMYGVVSGKIYELHKIPNGDNGIGVLTECH